MYFEVVFLNYN